MIDRCATDSSIRVTDRSKLVFLILEEIRIDRSGPDVVIIGKTPDFCHIAATARQIPEYVQSELWGNARQCMDFSSVGELLLQAGGSRGLQKFAKPGARVRKPP
jgi:hypothetical protein